MKAKLLYSAAERVDYHNSLVVSVCIARRRVYKDLADYRDFITLTQGDDVGTIIRELEDLTKRLKTFCIEVK